MARTYDDKLPKKPAVTSQAAADAEFERWLKENNFDRIKDGDGQVWHLSLEVQRLPEPAVKEAAWILTIHLKTTVTADSLLTTDIYQKDQDQRILEMIGTQAIELCLKPVQYRAVSREDARRLLTKILPETRAKLLESSLRDVKRGLVGRWVDKSRMFGAGSL